MNRVKNFSIISYIVLFGSIYGKMIYPDLFTIWIIFSFVGSILLVFKNRMSSLQRFKWMKAVDVLITIFLVLITFITGLSLGTRQLIFLIIVAGYLLFYFRIMFKSRFE